MQSGTKIDNSKFPEVMEQDLYCMLLLSHPSNCM